MTASRQLFCLARRVPVAATPEEVVRQNLLAHLLGPFGCPHHLLSVEVPLRAVSQRPIRAVRRLDIVCFCVKGDTLVPLLVIECKAKPPKRASYAQLNGYNFTLEAPFLALAWPNCILLGHNKKIVCQGRYCEMPSYMDLLALL